MRNKKFINKGNYSLDTVEREELFNKNRAFGIGEKYHKYRKQWEDFATCRFVSEHPLQVDLELSTVCNLNCRFCYTVLNGYKEKIKARFMSFVLFKKIIDEITDKVFAVRLSLRGESTLNPDFIRAIKYAKKKGIKEVSTLTNGSKLTLEFFEQIMQAGIDWITLSFDGLYEEYEKNRVPLKFEAMYEQLKEIKEFKEKKKAVKPVIKIQSIWPAISNNPAEFYNKMSRVSDLVAFNPLINFNYNENSAIQYEGYFSCPQIYQRLVVGADGLVMLCTNDERSEYIIGDANKEKIHEIWHGERMNNARDMHARKNGFKNMAICRKCYLPRKTKQDTAEVNGRIVLVRNYV